MESNFNSIPIPEEEYDVEYALREAGLSGVIAPRKGTKAYDRLVTAAKNYMFEVRKVEKVSTSLPNEDSENYFQHKQQVSSLGSSDGPRRQYHHELTMMLLGKARKGLPNVDANAVSNFAAYLTDNDEYVNSWSKNI